MLRTHTNGELRMEHVGQTVTLCGWVQKTRDKGGMLWIDLRDRYGITQLMLEEGKSDPAALALARGLGREFVVAAEGLVVERLAKNDKLPTGDVEIKVSNLRILNPAKLPPFLIEEENWTPLGEREHFGDETFSFGNVRALRNFLLYRDWETVIS